MSTSRRDSERLREARRWLRYAEEDLLLAEAIAADPSRIPRHACYAAQQAAEKALKAGLVYLQIKFPRQHDLDGLQNLFPANWSAVQSMPPLAPLTHWAIEARYPGDLPDATVGDAETAVSSARTVYETIVGDLEALGFRR